MNTQSTKQGPQVGDTVTGRCGGWTSKEQTVMSNQHYVICWPTGDPYTVEDPHYTNRGNALEAIKSLGPVAILQARTGQLLDPCGPGCVPADAALEGTGV